ncbi:thiamine-binding protein [Gottfriedia sp. S16(2024)]|uniref:thiamine-binding protein n=1 Tax=Gottfriedia sp. S16(2024) TaxID=3162883 RepID=UPI003D21A99F
MAKTTTINFNDFMSGAYKTPRKAKLTLPKRKPQTVKEAVKDVIGIISASGLAYRVISMETVLAASADATFGNVHGALMKAFDAGVVLVIIFAGASWALGHRTKAIEIIIGVCCGYVLARHAIDIRDFLKGI